eukprot:scaffold116254_cov16-Tisochrysis_lutea.AAC.1
MQKQTGFANPETGYCQILPYTRTEMKRKGSSSEQAVSIAGRMTVNMAAWDSTFNEVAWLL